MKFRIETSQLVIRDILPRRYVSSVQVFTYLICLCMRKHFRFTLLKADELFSVISIRISDYILICLLPKKKKIPSDYNSFFEIGSFCLSMPWDNQLKRVKLRNKKKSPKLWDHQPVICLQQHQFSFSWWKLSILGHFIIDLTQFLKSTVLAAHCVFNNMVIVTRRPEDRCKKRHYNGKRSTFFNESWVSL